MPPIGCRLFLTYTVLIIFKLLTTDKMQRIILIILLIYSYSIVLNFIHDYEFLSKNYLDQYKVVS